MPTHFRTILLASVAAILGATGAEPEKPQSTEPKKSEPVSIETARQQSKLMQEIYVSTLESLHKHFFRRDRSVLPARAMEDIFADLEKKSKIKAKWIAVNTKAMSVNHEAKTEFEKMAAAAIDDGNEFYEKVVDGYYNRAVAIPLGSSCIGCHGGFGTILPKTPRFAGLIVSIPVNGK